MVIDNNGDDDNDNDNDNDEYRASESRSSSLTDDDDDDEDMNQNYDNASESESQNDNDSDVDVIRHDNLTRQVSQRVINVNNVNENESCVNCPTPHLYEPIPIPIRAAESRSSS